MDTFERSAKFYYRTLERVRILFEERENKTGLLEFDRSIHNMTELVYYVFKNEVTRNGENVVVCI